MPTIIVINGPAGVGKSTISAQLVGALPNTISISGDCLRSFAPAHARALLGAGSTYRAAAALINSYLKMGAEIVLFDYIFTTYAQLQDFRHLLPPDERCKFHIFTLWAPLATVEQREATRQNRERLGPQVQTTYEAIRKALPAFSDSLGHIVSNTTTPEDATKQILSTIKLSGTSKII